MHNGKDDQDSDKKESAVDGQKDVVKGSPLVVILGHHNTSARSSSSHRL